MNIEEVSFKNLQKICVDLATSPTNRNAEILRQELDKISAEDVEKFFPFILFSIKLTLKKCRQEGDNKISKVTKICLLESLHNLLVKCNFSTKDINFAADLFSDLICLISVTPGCEEIYTESDDFININLTCLIAIIEKIQGHNEKIKNFFNSKEFRPVLAHLISCLLKLLHNNNCKNLSIICLKRVLSLSDAVASSFLPGVSSVLLEILLNSSQTTEEEFFSSSFQVLSDIILAAARDEKNLTEEWRITAGLQLKNLIDRLSAVFVCHSWTKSRQCLAHFVRNILSTETQILKESKKRALEVLSALIMDQNLIEINENFIDSRKYREEINSNLSSICWRLPRMSKSNQFDIQQRIEWQQFCGCMKLLGGQNLGYFFLNDVQAKLFCRSLCEAIEFNDIVWEVDIKDNLGDSVETSESDARISIRHPSDLYAQQLIFVCFDILSDVTELETVLDNFYHFFQTKQTFKIQSAFVLNGILNCLSKKHCRYPSDLIENLLEDYLTWLDGHDMNFQINLNLALNGIAVAASLIKNDIQYYLVKALYLILRLLDSPTTKQIARSTLEKIGKNFGCTAKILVLNNLDYLTSSIMTKLKQLSLNLEAPKVLSSLLDVVDVENIDCIRYAVVECLSAVDRCRVNNVALPILLKCLAKFGCLCQKILPAKVSSTTEIEEDDENFEAEQHKEKLQWHVQLIVDILNSVQCWLGAENFSIRIQAMDALRENLIAIKLYQDQLLPAVHRCWPSVLSRFKDAETTSKSLAFGIIMTLVRTSGDFVRRRIETEAYSILEEYLTVNIDNSRRAGVSYRQSVLFRLQLNICDSLDELCERICASDEFIDKCRSLLNLYALDNQQPDVLRNSALKSLDNMKVLKEKMKL